jgi:type II secretory ATPase GspE/PulE/Tfp pilus assembly ATPase PilB-like protein
MNRRLGEILLARRLISPQALDQALKEQQQTGELLGQALIRLGCLTEHQLLEGLAEHLQLPIVNLKNIAIDPQVVKTVPARFAWHYRCMPMRLAGKTVTLAMSDPLQVRPVDDLKVHYGLEADIVLSTEAEIQEAIQRCYGVGADTVGEILETAPQNGPAAVATTAAEPTADIERLAEDASVTRLVHQLLLEAYRARASDVHLEPFRDALQIRYRIDGLLYDVPVPEEIRRFHQAIISHLKSVSGLKIMEKRLPQDGRIKVTVGQEEVELRVSIMPSLYGEDVVLRLLPVNRLFDLEQLGMVPDDLKTLERLIAKPHGVIFVTGPTGSGKTTTLYACLSRLNTPHRKIITLESPVEYELKGATQIPVTPQLGFSFMEGLRSMLRHDPDVMMVGEVQDRESADITVRMALTGHLVFSTLHTNDAASSVTRLLDMGIEPYLVSSTVLAFIAQRLVRVICPDCKTVDHEPLALPPLSKAQLPPTLYKGTGCDTCRMSGYRGRLGLYEILVVDDAVRALILAKAPVEQIKAALQTTHWKTMRQDGWQKVAVGKTTAEEVLRVTMEG